MGNGAAFFDIDGTIYREGLITEVFKKMIKYDLIDNSKWHSEVRPAFINWDRRLGDYDTYLLKMVDVYSEAVKGISPFHMAYVAKRVIEQKGDRVYTFSRERIKWHKEEGHKLIAISGSPIELVSEVANKYGMDDYRGTIYEVDKNGKYSGEIIPMWDSKSKKNAILEIVSRNKLDLQACYAYGDTSGDFTMLKMVGYPFAINPTKELITRISEDAELRKKIKIIVERKDVTYRLNIEGLDCFN
ncbi:HAD-IB family hydrolase [Cellulosilyticum sp. I15G10I2]|uniref:HAD-IB family hydrolase n=1 Tax=Cellulosilyticum sp. I15G10I2 TaxID=1892843 RepID=UPI00085C0AFE|nr:HAD-IB family hydrolase [Cellulosilyticum sp. I15G10I2]